MLNLNKHTKTKPKPKTDTQLKRTAHLYCEKVYQLSTGLNYSSNFYRRSTYYTAKAEMDISRVNCIKPRRQSMQLN